MHAVNGVKYSDSIETYVGQYTQSETERLEMTQAVEQALEFYRKVGRVPRGLPPEAVHNENKDVFDKLETKRKEKVNQMQNGRGTNEQSME